MVNKFYSSINIAGLAIGLASAIMLLLWVQNEFSFDTFYKDVDHIYRVNTEFKAQSKEGKEVVYAVTPPAIKSNTKNIPKVASTVRIMDNGTGKFYGNKQMEVSRLTSAFVDSSFLSVFNCEVLFGNQTNFLSTDNSVAITASVAKKMFGNENALGKILHYENQVFTINTILSDFPDNASFRYEVLLPLSFYGQQFLNKYGRPLDANQGSYNFNTFVKVQKGADIKKIAATINSLHEARTNGDKRFVYELQPLKDIHLVKPDHDNSDYRLVQIFLIIVIMLFLIASINYINLSTARSLVRVKEVGIRKIVGARKKQLFFQFMVETAMLFFIALLIAIVLIYAFMPLYSDLSGKVLHFDLSDCKVWEALLLLVLGTLLLTSIYPAVVLSSFKPLQILKGRISTHMSATFFRKALVVFQFCISTALLFATVVISKQLRYIRDVNIGYDTNYVFSVSFPDAALPHIAAIKTQLLKQKSIQGVSACSAENFTDLNVSSTGIRWPGKDDNNSFFIYPASVDAEFIPTMKMDMLAGHNFTGKPIDSSGFILNETAVKQMGLVAPYIGQSIKFGHEGTIIGIVKDFNFQSLKSTIAPLIFYASNKKHTLYVRTQANDAKAAIEAVQSEFRLYADNDTPFSYHFLDQQFEAQYRSDIQTGSLFNTFTGIAVFISCLGLFGLATYTAQVMKKEIGIRKILGASNCSIVKLISKDFLKLVIIAIIIALPIAYWAMAQWLDNFAYQTKINILTFGMVFSAIIMVAIGAVGTKAIGAARANPLDSIIKD